MLEDYKDLINEAHKLATKECEGFAVVNGGEKVPSCVITSKKLFDVKVDKPLFNDNEWKKFWELCKEMFPLHSVHGTAQNISQIESWERSQANTYNFLNMPTNTKLYRGKVFEIGYGYGCFGKEIMKKDTWDADYYGIDYVSSDKSLLKYKKNGRKRFYEINKSGIPVKFQKQKFDLIYSVNVMQHLTQKQRKDYFKQIAKMMNSNSVFYFDVFEWNYVDKGEKMRDDYNCNFFGVKTHVDTPVEMENMLHESGLKIFNKQIQFGCCNETNKVTYVCVLK